MPRAADHYAALNLAPSASDAEIKRRYRELMRRVHPDANAGDPHATRKAARLNHAFEILGSPEKRRAYDAERARSNGKLYAHLAEHPDWEDIVAESVPPRRPLHVHGQQPAIAPDEIEVSVEELERSPRVRRTISITNRCDCTMRGEVSTSEPWVWGPIGGIRAGPGETASFDIEIIANKVVFPGVSRVTVVALWIDATGAGVRLQSTHVVPVNVTGFRSRNRQPPYDTDARYVHAGNRRTKWAKYRR